MGITKKQFVNGASWKIMGDFSVKGITFLVSVVLMRLLSAEDYGLIALTNVFTSLSDIMIEGGFSTALIRKDKVDSLDYGCVLSVSGLISIVLYMILFLVAPFAAQYYHQPLLISVLRVVGLSLFLQVIASIRTAVVNRNFQFRLLSVCNTAGSIISGTMGIAAAYMGMGVWALVIQRLSQIVISNVLLFLKVKVKIKLSLEKERLKEIFRFSIGVVSSSLLNYVGGSAYSIVIGKRYSVSDLGYYDKGSQLPMQLSLYTFGSMSSVLLPTLASYQNDLGRVKEICRKVMRMTAYLIFPMMIGLLLTSTEITVMLFTEKWLPSVPMMKSFCIYYLATPFMLINVQVFFALGHSFLRVKTEVIRLIMMAVGLIVVAFILKMDVNAVALTMAVVAVLSAIVTFMETRKLIAYTWSEVLQDIWKAVSATVIMGSAITGVQLLMTRFFPSVTGYLIPLGLKVLLGVGLYFLISKWMKIHELNEILDMISGFVPKYHKQKSSPAE